MLRRISGQVRYRSVSRCDLCPRDRVLLGLRYSCLTGWRGGTCRDENRGMKIGRVLVEILLVTRDFILQKDLDTGVFGHVAYTSDYIVRTSKCLNDWCLIRLEADSHERRLSELSNRAYIAPPPPPEKQ
ncbi:hypothetical protein LX36DRAFT_242554 [Colletotrichum falcatum]|nr:hypothetical protein LX36DRAFT_242554 [Colletotrichum falcatum]